MKNHLHRYVRLATCAVLVTLGASCASPKALPSSSTKPLKQATSQALISGWEQIGFKKGQQAPDFTLLSIDNHPFTLSKELEKKKKPVVLISASYTCDVSRANLESILSFGKTYSKYATFFIVYTMEAHPSDEPGPYTADNEIVLPKSNIRDKVQAKQPRIYAERQALADRWKKMYKVPMTVLIDSPDNFFWTNFGQAPNMVYVIAPDRTVLYKQAWFIKKMLESELQKLTSR